MRTVLLISVLFLTIIWSCQSPTDSRQKVLFNDNWQFQLTDFGEPNLVNEGNGWRKLNLPHDWSIEGDFDPENPAGVGGGALPGGIGWYRKQFEMTKEQLDKKVFIRFDGVYQNSTVWINGQRLGTRPNGYISFEYDLTPYLKLGENTLDVKVDNSQQPNSRWYSGSGIYRKVHLITTDKIHIPQWGQYVTTDDNNVTVETELRNDANKLADLTITTNITQPDGRVIETKKETISIAAGQSKILTSQLKVAGAELWTLQDPNLYRVETSVTNDGEVVDNYSTTFGFRSFSFDPEHGFNLNGQPVKIKGVCLHHDLGSLGAAFNERAMERQLEIMKTMGVNAIRTSHNPPAPELLDLCDEMGLLVMDEMFDMWSIKKTEFDYSQYWEEWHARDLKDFILRDRNHPSIVVWSIGNEIMEQYNHEDSTGGMIAQELASIVRSLDDRSIVTANNDTSPENPLIALGGLDIVGYNYHHDEFELVPERFPGQPFIATETNSELATRGHYDMPSDSVRIWPIKWDEPFHDGNPDNTVSAYDNVRPPWGSSHEDTWRIVKNNDFISGMFIWTGFDYIGEPTPYEWPSRSSYFGIVDLAGFPKDSYYMYQSEWTEDTVLHIFPHWTWQEGQEVDIWAYYNHADEVELFLNGKSLGTKSKPEDTFHVMWRVTFEPGTLKAVSRKDGTLVKTQTINTAGAPAKIALEADRSLIDADGEDLAFVTVKVLDKDGNLVPNADNRIRFKVKGAGFLRSVDNGDQTNHESFQADNYKAFNGLCLAVIQSDRTSGEITLIAESDGLSSAEIKITSQPTTN